MNLQPGKAHFVGKRERCGNPFLDTDVTAKALLEGAGERDGTLRVYIVAEGITRVLPHIVVHSPTGFECGYHGSGPADLALSMAVAALDRDDEFSDIHYGKRAWRCHQRLKREIVAKLPQDQDWAVELDEVRAAIERWEREASEKEPA